MSNELDNLLASQEEQKKKQEAEQRQLWRKQNVFIADFKKALDEIIHPAMIDILKKLRDRDYYGVVLSQRKQQSNPMSHIKPFDEPPKIDAKSQMEYRHYENYYISAHQLAKGMCLILTVLGNYALQKICIFTEYIKTGGPTGISLKKTEKRCEIAEMTADFFDALVAGSIKELLAIKQQPDENKPSF